MVLLFLVATAAVTSSKPLSYALLHLRATSHNPVCIFATNGTSKLFETKSESELYIVRSIIGQAYSLTL